jgi:hypothetical protein
MLLRQTMQAKPKAPAEAADYLLVFRVVDVLAAAGAEHAAAGRASSCRTAAT